MTDAFEMLDESPDTIVAFGEGCFTQFAAFAEEEAVSKILVVTGGNSADKNGAWQNLLASAACMSIEISRHSGVRPEPDTEDVMKIHASMAALEPDLIVAIGGGSVMDATKAAYLLYQGGGKLEDYWGLDRYSSQNPGKRLKRIVCFPTSAGTGSEATPYANIVDRVAGVKKLIVEKEIIPGLAFLSPQLTCSMPQELTRDTACDALAHLIEGFLNVKADNAHPSANEWSLAGMRLIVKNLPRVLANGEDIKARGELLAAACLGGMVIRYKPTSLPHLCSYSWYGRIAHGLAVAILLPHAWSYYLEESKVRERTKELKGIFPGNSNSPQEIISGYREFLSSCGVPESLQSIPEMNLELLERTALSASQNSMKLESAPRAVPLDKSAEILRGILHSAWKGR
ncbi:MAG: hypothetical protein A2X49_02640 [Lentisphaerae bacterium GWF2_52_8]|nr:MAG: hypothetical protein A2X49_02640 [Lentisphaerae bacterium GWF2_52_8]